MGTVFNTFCYPFYAMIPSLSQIENQLKNRWKYPYNWYKKQNDHWDKSTNFIYEIPEWEPLIKAIASTVSIHKFDKKECFYYAINRWYNFWSSVAVEEIFCSLPEVEPAKNIMNKRVDFTIKGIPFDHKTSVFPKGFKNNYAFAKAHKEKLLYWLYSNQSQEGRKHLANRLFIIVYAEDGHHWKLKAEISLLHKAISNYVATFDANQLTHLSFPEKEEALSDIIWVEK